MILLADSGSSKTNWQLIQNGQSIGQAQSPGINPFYENEKDITIKLEQHLSQFREYPIQKIYFYGAGCAFPEQNQIVANALTHFFSASKPQIEIQSDLLGAARSLCQHTPGITCILGTGSNSCYYNGKEIEQNISPLGFILGDEGSGAVLGRQLIADYLKNQLPESLAEKFREQYPHSPAEILDRVYKQAFPNRFLASFTPFLAENLADPACAEIVERHFNDFFQRNIFQYPNYHELQVHFVGSVAFHFKSILSKVAKQNGIQLGRIVKDPMEGIVTYHSSDSVQ